MNSKDEFRSAHGEPEQPSSATLSLDCHIITPGQECSSSYSIIVHKVINNLADKIRKNQLFVLQTNSVAI